MDPHRLAEERSLAYHRVVAERVRRDPSVLAMARARVEGWLADSSPFHALRWREILAGDIEEVAAFLTARSERAAELRQSSPFAGILSARERWHIWRTTAQSLSAEP